MKRIIFDFDGTLIDSRERLFKLFSDLEPDSKLTFEDYWNLKRDGESHEKILNRLKGNKYFEQSNFEAKWMELIEDNNYLNLDTPFEGVTQLLERLRSDGYDLWLLTARQHSSKVGAQLLNFGWHNMFSKTMVTGQILTKKALLLDETPDFKSSIMIGDTGKDIMTAQEVGAYSIAVLSGFLSLEKLKTYKPNEFLNNVTELFSSRFFKSNYGHPLC
jgi:phosphoglycolate phosphatase